MISGVVICLNEENHIRACIDQLHWVDEIVVVDGGSIDKTVSILKDLKKDFNLRVYAKKFNNHFADQKNFAMSMAKGDWLFVLDADERIEPELIDELKQIAIPNNKYDMVAIPRKNYIDGDRTMIYPDYQYRFCRAYCRYIYSVHEEMLGYRRVYKAKHHILHYKVAAKQEEQNEYYKTIRSMTNGLRYPHEVWD